MLISDMDSTMIAVECIDELADYAGLKAEIAAVTERAMMGELDFVEALRGRVALLQGLSEQALGDALTERVVLTPGARTLVRTMRARGAHCVLVSGGFTHFSGPVADMIGFHEHHSNRLGLADGALTGSVEGDIVDSARKAALLGEIADARGLDPADVLAIGDGANDIAMIEAAGLGVAYHAKEKARLAADAWIAHNDLTALLYAQGIAPAEWVTD
jgi:phosphoserine phosphatase